MDGVFALKPTLVPRVLQRGGRAARRCAPRPAVQMLPLNSVLAHVARVLVRASPNGNGYGVLRAGRVRHAADKMRASLPGVLFEADTFVACALRWGRKRGAPHDSSETLLR
jgi:hypothetical protein